MAKHRKLLNSKISDCKNYGANIVILAQTFLNWREEVAQEKNDPGGTLQPVFKKLVVQSQNWSSDPLASTASTFTVPEP